MAERAGHFPKTAAVEMVSKLENSESAGRAVGLQQLGAADLGPPRDSLSRRRP